MNVDDAKEPTKKRKPWQFQPGNHANDAGRPLGSKNKFTLLKDQLVEAVHAAAKVAGYKSSEAYLASLFAAKPMDFLRIAAGVLPKEQKNINTGGGKDELRESLRDMPVEDLDRLEQAVRDDE